MLTISPLETKRTESLWPYLEPILRPAIATGSLSSGEVLSGLKDGGLQCWTVTGGPEGLIVTSVGTVKGCDTLACWVLYAANSLQNTTLRNMRELIAHFAALATVRGCNELRVESPRWGGPLTRLGFVRDGNILRKAL